MTLAQASHHRLASWPAEEGGGRFRGEEGEETGALSLTNLWVLLNIPAKAQHILSRDRRRFHRVDDLPRVGRRGVVRGRRRLRCKNPELLAIRIRKRGRKLRPCWAADRFALWIASTGRMWHWLAAIGVVNELVRLAVRGGGAQPLPRSQLQAGTGFNRQAEPGGKVPTSTSRAGICSSGRPSR